MSPVLWCLVGACWVLISVFHKVKMKINRNRESRDVALGRSWPLILRGPDLASWPPSGHGCAPQVQYLQSDRSGPTHTRQELEMSERQRDGRLGPPFTSKHWGAPDINTGCTAAEGWEFTLSTLSVWYSKCSFTFNLICSFLTSSESELLFTCLLLFVFVLLWITHSCTLPKFLWVVSFSYMFMQVLQIYLRYSSFICCR